MSHTGNESDLSLTIYRHGCFIIQQQKPTRETHT